MGMKRSLLAAAILGPALWYAPARTAIPEAPPGLLYVCNQDAASVSVIDLSAQAVVRTIDLKALGFAPNAKPHHIVAEPDGSFWYLSLIGAGRVVKFDREDRIVAQIEFETPGMMALHPSRDLLYVGRSMTAVNPPPRIGIVRRSDMSLEEVDIFLPRPHALAVHPSGSHVFVGSMSVNQIAALNTATEEVTLADVSGPPHALVQFAFSPDGRLLATGGHLTSRFLLFDASQPPRLEPLTALDVELMPWDPVFSPDGRRVYFGNNGANTVSVFDVETRSVTAVIRGPGLSEPWGVAVTPDGSRLYVSNNNAKGGYVAHHATSPADRPGTVVVIRTSDHAIESVIEVGKGPTGIGLIPRP
jgi:YVTN family beta-propeller protein